MRMHKCIPGKTEDVYLKDEGNEDLALSRTQANKTYCCGGDWTMFAAPHERRQFGIAKETGYLK